ncbi:MAG: helix-turn-helix domain-containing protein [Candidatus Eremiobacteraeota bacterium]|nr:helix-turn-helix domain-containing protein [Candidatus Eremiobacteraeota bacterium]
MAHECEPFAALPAWWSGFLFHVLNPRQLSMYVYLTMLSDTDGACHPTVEQIRKDLGLLSTTMVFEAIAMLEEYGFFLRTRRSFPQSRSKRNVYQRTACEYTILRLLECDKIDGYLRPTASLAYPASDESRRLVTEGLAKMLGGSYLRYEAADESSKRGLLVEILNELVRSRNRGIYQ